MRKTWIFSLAAGAGFLLACNLCGFGELIERLRKTLEEKGGITTAETGREPDFEGFGFSLVLPDGWEIIGSQPPGSLPGMEITWARLAHEEGLEAGVTCIIDPKRFEGKSAEEVARYMVRELGVDLPPAIDEGWITVSGVKGYEATYVMEEGSFAFRYIALATEDQSRIFTVEFSRYGENGFTSADKREMKRFLEGIRID